VSSLGSSENFSEALLGKQHWCNIFRSRHSLSIVYQGNVRSFHDDDQFAMQIGRKEMIMKFFGKFFGCRREAVQTLAAALAICLSSAVVRADNLAYATVTPSGTGGFVGYAFGTVDLDTGSFTQIAGPQTTVAQIAELNGVLYGTYGAAGASTLYRADPSNFALTPVGNTGVSLQDLGSTPNGIFGITAGPNAPLYSIDPTTGKATLIGTTGLDLTYSDFAATTQELSNAAQGLYLLVGNGSTLVSSIYSLDTTTGAATLLGQDSVGACLKGMAEINGTLYAGSGYCTAGSNIYTINPNNYQATLVTTAAYFDMHSFAPLISSSSVPEPTSTTLLGGIVFAIAGIGRKIWKKRLGPL
jgi:hypothetical protein